MTPAPSLRNYLLKVARKLTTENVRPFFLHFHDSIRFGQINYVFIRMYRLCLVQAYCPLTKLYHTVLRWSTILWNRIRYLALPFVVISLAVLNHFCCKYLNELLRYLNGWCVLLVGRTLRNQPVLCTWQRFSDYRTRICAVLRLLRKNTFKLRLFSLPLLTESKDKTTFKTWDQFSITLVLREKTRLNDWKRTANM